MSTKSEFLTAVRLRLADPLGKRWADDELNAYLDDAARDYSKYFPRKRDQEFTADGEAFRYDVPDDLIDDQVQQVYLVIADTNSIEQIPHRLVRRRSSFRYYEVVDQEIVFGFAPEVDRTVQVRYNATHTMPESGSSSIPFEDEDLVFAYVMACAWQRIGGNDAGLSRWTEDQKRDDSPIIPHYARLWARYERLVTQKFGTPRFYRRVRAKGDWRDGWRN